MIGVRKYVYYDKNDPSADNDHIVAGNVLCCNVENPLAAVTHPRKSVARLNLAWVQDTIDLINTCPRAYQVFLFLVGNMDDDNTVLCSQTVLQEVFGVSRQTIQRAVRALKDANFVDVEKRGNTNAFLINKEIIQ